MCGLPATSDANRQTDATKCDFQGSKFSLADILIKLEVNYVSRYFFPPIHFVKMGVLEY